MDNLKWKLNTSYKLGSKKFSKEEIFEFAKQNDPLDFHLNLEAAQKSIFKGLVCSGGQPFYHFYAKQWVPLFGKTVIAGIGVNEWQFHSPILCRPKGICKMYNK